MGQESTTYTLSRHSKNPSGDQWTEFNGTGINDLQPVKAFKKTQVVISGQNSMGQESMTYTLSRHSKNPSGDQWTEFGGTAINDLQPVKAFNKPKW
jgi:hypothetical protein